MYFQGRYENYKSELFQLNDRHATPMLLGPVITKIFHTLFHHQNSNLFIFFKIEMTFVLDIRRSNHKHDDIRTISWRKAITFSIISGRKLLFIFLIWIPNDSWIWICFRNKSVEIWQMQIKIWIFKFRLEINFVTRRRDMVFCDRVNSSWKTATHLMWIKRMPSKLMNKLMIFMGNYSNLLAFRLLKVRFFFVFFPIFPHYTEPNTENGLWIGQTLEIVCE